MSSPQLSFGPFHLESEPECLRRGTEQIPLRPKSLDVLRYLAERPRQLVSKEELLKRVWSGRVVSDDGLRVCVREIRAALGDNAETPDYLETVSGQGYRFLEGRDGRALIPERAGPVVGRESELRQLDNYFYLAANGQRQLVLLGGEPGIGKTTLLTCFLDRLSEQHSVRIAQGQCVVHYSKGEPYGPLLEAFARWGKGPAGTEVLHVLRQHAPMWLLQLPGLVDATELEQLQRQVEGATPERMTRELCEAIKVLANDTPLVLVLEDLHWADQSTIDLLATIAQRPASSRLLVLATYRPADAVLYAPHLRHVVQELRGRDQCNEMLLELLTKEDVGGYLTGRLNGGVSETLVTKIFQRTNGNPLFMVNLVEDLIQGQLLVQDEAHWTASDQARNLMETVPESLRSLISRRLEALTGEQRQVLEAASVVGLEFSGAAIAGGLEQTISDIDAQCESLAAQGQFIEAVGLDEWPDGTISGQYRFQHPLYHDVLYEQIGEARRAQLHRCIGERLEAGYG